MARLTRESVFERFGFVNGQVSAEMFARAQEWFNQDGEHIGSGDLGVEHFNKLTNGLYDGEFFNTVPAPEVFFGKVEKTIESVIGHALFMVSHGQLYCVTDDDVGGVVLHGGLTFVVVNREEALTIVRVFVGSYPG